MGRDNFSKNVKDALYKRVGGRCSNPSCMIETAGPHENPQKCFVIGQAAHITAASEGGPRYDESLTKKERSSIENGIWLCNNCAKRIDSEPNKFDVTLLREWKKSAEEAQLRRIGRGLPINDKIIRHETTYITLESDDDSLGIRYCSRCFDANGLLVQLYCHGGIYECPNCSNVGNYDKVKASKTYKALYRKNRVVSKGFEL